MASGLMYARQKAFARRAGMPATVYDNDGVTHPRAVQAVISNRRALPQTNVLANRLQGRIVSAVGIPLGSVMAVPGMTAGWYLIANALQSTESMPGHAVQTFSLLALPAVLTVDRIAVPPAPEDLTIYDEPATVDSGGHPVIATETQVTVRAGFSNSYDPLNDQKEGPLPLGLTTAYVPLGSAVTKDDTLLLPDGTPAMVQQTNVLYADGAAYALQLILAATVGSGLVGG